MHSHRLLGSSRAIKIAVAIVIPLTTMGVLSVTGGVASANPPVNFLGGIGCAMTGTTSFTPPLLNSSQGAISATFTGRTSYCTGLNGTKLTQGGATLKTSSGTAHYSFTIPAHKAGACYDLTTGGTLPAASGMADWSGTAPIATTKLKFGTATIGTTTDTGLLTYATGSSTGSFSGLKLGDTGPAKLKLQASKIGTPDTTKLLPYSEANVTFVCSTHGISHIQWLQPTPTTNKSFESGTGA